MSAILHLQRKGEPWRQYTFPYGDGYMRMDGYTKGFCYECNKWKLFRIDHVYPLFQMVYATGTPVGIAENHGTEYHGTCTNGHSGIFAPWTRPEPKRWKRDATGLNDLHECRGILAKQYYLAWREMFRQPDREAHYKHGHECDEGCPEYEWDWMWD